MSVRPGDRLRCIEAPKMPGKTRAPFAVGDIVIALKVSESGLVLTDRHNGWFTLSRFTPA